MPINSYLVTVLVIAAIVVLVLIVAAATVVSIGSTLRRYRSRTEASARLVTVELERRYEQLGAFISAAEDAGLANDRVLQLVGARSWSKAVRERALGLRAQAAAENALSVAIHDVLSEAELHTDLKGNWAFHGPAADLATTEQRISGAVRVYNDNAYALSRMTTSFPAKLVTKAKRVDAPEPFVELKLVEASEPAAAV